MLLIGFWRAIVSLVALIVTIVALRDSAVKGGGMCDLRRALWLINDQYDNVLLIIGRFWGSEGASGAPFTILNPISSSMEEKRLPYQGHAPVVCHFLKQISRPRKWYLQVTYNPLSAGSLALSDIFWRQKCAYLPTLTLDAEKQGDFLGYQLEWRTVNVDIVCKMHCVC